MKFKPLSDYVLLKPLEAAKKTSGGIVLPDVAKEKTTRGEVLAVGEGAFCSDVLSSIVSALGPALEAVQAREGAMDRLGSACYKPMSVKVGQVVRFVRYGSIEIEEGGEKYLLVRESEILAVEEV